MPIPKPNAGQSESDFVASCNESLASEFPDTEQRNAVCFKQWREAKGESAEDKKARETFDASKYQKRENIALFPEHVKNIGIEDPKNPGKMKKVALTYDRGVLETIIEKNNARIRDTGSFSPLVKGHTDDEGDSKNEPEVLGYVGPFRLGVIGDENPRYAIMADEWHRLDKSEDLDSRRRRSVEVHIGDPNKSEWFIDPVAALGATTPELDTGIARYAKEQNGELTLRYQMSGCAAMPSGTNTFIPSSGLEKKKKDLNAKDSQMDEDSIVKKCVEAVAAMLPKMMEDHHTKMEAEKMADKNAMDEEEEVDKNAAEPGEEEEAKAAEEETKEGEEMHKQAEKYQRELKKVQDVTAREVKALKDQNARMVAQMEGFRQEAADVKRTSQLETLRLTKVFDLEKKMTKCLYSRGSSMGDDQFSAVLEDIDEMAEKIPINSRLPRAVEPNDSKDRNAKMDRAFAIANAAVAAGKHVTWEEALAQAEGK